MGRIDYVVPMVFPDDVLWQRDFEMVSSDYAAGHTRWRSWDTEQELIRLVKKNMPWIRKIYVLLARKSQTRYWMNNEGVTVVYHKDFIPRSFLPVFNSCTIEMFLHKIPGLSEQFIYGNDDMFPLSPMEESDFFVDGKPCLHMNEVPFPEQMNIFHRSCQNGQSFVEGMFGVSGKNWLKNGHSLAPLRKSTIERIWDKRPKEMNGSITTFRSARNFSQYIYSWYQYYDGGFVDKVIRKRYVNAANIDADELERIIKETQGVLCINDNSKVENYKSLAKAAKNALNNTIYQ